MLIETNQDGSGVTTFTVDDTDGGESARVTIATDIVRRPGVSGFPERLFVSLMLPQIYRTELARLTEYVARQRPTDETSFGRLPIGRS